MMLFVTVTPSTNDWDWLGTDNFGAVHRLQPQAAAAAALGAVAHDQVGVDHQPRAGAIAQARRTIDVGRGTALGRPRSTMVMPSGAAPMTITPPPLVGTVGLMLWLNTTELCSKYRRLAETRGAQVRHRRRCSGCRTPSCS